MRLEQLTDRELDMTRRMVEAEVVRRWEVREAARREAARELIMRAQLDRDDDPIGGVPLERVPAKPLIEPLPGHGGVILRIENGMRVVACATCPETFTTPRRRGRAPRSCPTCRGDA